MLSVIIWSEGNNWEITSNIRLILIKNVELIRLNLDKMLKY